ncbi:MAG: 3-methyl-2-oxobutanoate hydroxymethyltransferase [Hallerella succinigenes]|uniref:3-methyl-2-oxobutanoate hydroxymethyltransferase n=1 Tax=Hallerella succinigenes TaxID=1896222 RepID=UPI0023F417AE|nr:3-methyl-2-oxobutanoate hydroxymethyltransferase [Hallerella succinigenes]MDD6092426.1 3-methyl-2-oxobutanoate hydroxymethyltransferase [Hallerella succinigenes]
MLSAQQIKERKGKQKIAQITTYDFGFANIAEAAGIDQILVGDSLANTMLGYKSTQSIGMTEMLVFTAAVCRGAPNTHVIADMPFKSYDDPKSALENAKRFMDVGASSVKLEGFMPDAIETLIQNGIPVCAHLGLLPQTAVSMKQVGKTEEEAERLLKEITAIDELGAYECVLEHIPDILGEKLTKAVSLITIGIGGGPHTDGHVTVLHDALGINNGKIPPFATKYCNIFDIAKKGIEDYVSFVHTEAL